MTVRLATVEDIPALVEMGAKFHAMSPHKFMGEYDGAATARMLRFMVESPQAVLMTNGEGVIGGTYAPVYFQPSTWMLEENFLWAKHGGADLLAAFEMHGKGWGARFVLMSILENERVGAMHRIMSRSGYRAVERRYMKDLSE